MRSFRFLALGAALVLTVVASHANATSLIEVQYIGGSSAGPAVGNDVPANVSDVLTFDVVVNVDSAGILGLGFDLRWVPVDLGFDMLTPVTGTIFTSFSPIVNQAAPSTQTAPFTPPTNMSVRQINNFGWTAPFGQAPGTNGPTEVFLGTVTFVVDSTDATMLSPGFFATDGSSATDGAATGFITPDFGSFTINMPAPGATLSLITGLATLAALSIRRRR